MSFTLTSLVLAVHLSPTPLVTSTMPAHVASRSLGFAASGFHVITDDPLMPRDLGVLWLEGASNVIESLDVVYRGGLGLGGVALGALGTGGRGVAPLVALEVQLRWYFGGDVVHPFLGVQLVTLYAVTAAGLNVNDLHAGAGIHGGLEVELADSVLLWLSPEFDWFIRLNRTQRFALSGSASLAFTF
ncbi:MAG: hypothetical protein JNJ54_31150 [Myxococcaceae bacterium]|nr:hypothetical protein [Myxococcaceae bacterium]